MNVLPNSPNDMQEGEFFKIKVILPLTEQQIAEKKEADVEEISIEKKYAKIFDSTFSGKRDGFPKELITIWLENLKKFEKGEIKVSRFSFSPTLRKELYEYLITKPSNTRMVDPKTINKKALNFTVDNFDEICEMELNEFINSVFNVEENPENYPSDEAKQRWLSTNFITSNGFVVLEHFLKSQPRIEVISILKKLNSKEDITGFFDIKQPEKKD